MSQFEVGIKIIKKYFKINRLLKFQNVKKIRVIIF